ADQLRHRRGQRFQRSLRRGAGGNLFRRGGKLFLHRTHGGTEPILRQLAANATLESGATILRRGVETIVPGLVRCPARAPCAAPHFAHLGGNDEGGLRPAASLPPAFHFPPSPPN